MAGDGAGPGNAAAAKTTPHPTRSDNQFPMSSRAACISLPPAPLRRSARGENTTALATAGAIKPPAIASIAVARLRVAVCASESYFIPTPAYTRPQDGLRNGAYKAGRKKCGRRFQLCVQRWKVLAAIAYRRG
jgi:hypothetical protein